jgi:hypothetical protein
MAIKSIEIPMAIKSIEIVAAVVRNAIKDDIMIMRAPKASLSLIGLPLKSFW